MNLLSLSDDVIRIISFIYNLLLRQLAHTILQVLLLQKLRCQFVSMCLSILSWQNLASSAASNISPLVGALGVLLKFHILIKYDKL